MEVLIVLNGGGFHRTGRLDEVTRNSLFLALELWRESKPDYIILTGGHLFGDKRFSSVMKSFLVKRGTPEQVILEERIPSLDTIQNIEGVLPILKELSPSRLGLIANTKRHLSRANWILLHALQREGINFQVLSLMASSPDGARSSLWEKISQLLCAVDPLGRTWLYRFLRWLMYKVQGIRC